MRVANIGVVYPLYLLTRPHVSGTMRADATEIFQSEVNNTMFVHYVRTVVQPMMLSLKKLVDSRVRDIVKLHGL